MPQKTSNVYIQEKPKGQFPVPENDVSTGPSRTTHGSPQDKAPGRQSMHKPRVSEKTVQTRELGSEFNLDNTLRNCLSALGHMLKHNCLNPLIPSPTTGT